MTRKTRCITCGCHEFDKTESFANAGVLLLWKCIDCGAETPRVNSRQLAHRKSKLIFETSAAVREQGKHRAIVVEPQPLIITMRLNGLRKTVEGSWEGVYNYLVKLAVQKQRAEKKAKRKGGLK